jgi:hypothetical protein
VQNIALAVSNAQWQAQFAGVTNWNYLLESSTNFDGWTQVASTNLIANGTVLLTDTNSAAADFYRVRALRR